MWKRIVLLGALAALTIVKPSNAVAQGWDGWGGGGGITVNVRFPFPRRDFCCEERRLSPNGTFAASAGFSPDKSSAATIAGSSPGRSGVRPIFMGIVSHRIATTGMGVTPMPVMAATGMGVIPTPVMATMNTERY
jgi:hypothetical protein